MEADHPVMRQEFWENIETDALSFCEFQPAYILSLLRTPAYMRAEVAGLQADARESTYERRVARQLVLGDPSRRFEFLMTEGALRWQIGSPELMMEQIARLTALSLQPNIHLGIIPWEQPSDIFIGHAFHLYNDEVVGIGTAHGVQKTAAPEIVGLYRDLFGKLRRIARFGEEARVQLERIHAQYEMIAASRRESTSRASVDDAAEMGAAR